MLNKAENLLNDERSYFIFFYQYTKEKKKTGYQNKITDT